MDLLQCYVQFSFSSLNRCVQWLGTWHLLLKICATLRNKSKQHTNIESIKKGVCQHRLMNRISFSHIFYVIKSFIFFLSSSMQWYNNVDEQRTAYRECICGMRRSKSRWEKNHLFTLTWLRKMYVDKLEIVLFFSQFTILIHCSLCVRSMEQVQRMAVCSRGWRVTILLVITLTQLVFYLITFKVDISEKIEKISEWLWSFCFSPSSTQK